LPSRRDIEAAVAAHNATDPDPLLPPEAVQLLAVMFRRNVVCQRRLEDLAAETGDTVRRVARLLRILTEIGFLSKEQGPALAPNIYRLLLPPLVRR
jgi:hypothetical protein